MSKVEKIAPARETAATERGKSEDSQEFSRTYQVILFWNSHIAAVWM